MDRETGAVRIHEVLLAADVGTIINPLAHQGQLEGGLMFGIGAALMEELIVQDGQITTMTLGDYKVPCAMDTPPFRTVLLRDPTRPGPARRQSRRRADQHQRRPGRRERRRRLRRAGDAHAADRRARPGRARPRHELINPSAALRRVGRRVAIVTGANHGIGAATAKRAGGHMARGRAELFAV